MIGKTITTQSEEHIELITGGPEPLGLLGALKQPIVFFHFRVCRCDSLT